MRAGLRTVNLPYTTRTVHVLPDVHERCTEGTFGSAKVRNYSTRTVRVLIRLDFVYLSTHMYSTAVHYLHSTKVHSYILYSTVQRSFLLLLSELLPEVVVLPYVLYNGTVQRCTSKGTFVQCL
jgi:hypothetical protein